MRWAPDGSVVDRVAATTGSSLATRREAPQGQAYCEPSALEAWFAEAQRLWDEATDDLGFDYQVQTVARREFPPCLGCGRPVGGLGEAVTISQPGEHEANVVFHPCGCELTVAAPPIFDHVPAGTRPRRFTCLVLTSEHLDHPEMLDHARERIIRQSDERPHVLRLVDAAEAGHVFGIELQLHLPTPESRALVAVWLEAIPGQLEHIVLRPALGMPPEVASADWDGRWQSHPASRYGTVGLAGTAHGPFGGLMTAMAHATGRIEIREDGAVAEVFEYRI